jgi:hypothetical protein
MGYMRHHAIVVSSWDDAAIQRAHEKARKLFQAEQVTEVLPAVVNGYRSFLVGPDGSKEGWEASDAGDEARKLFTTWLNTQRYEDLSTSLRWVEVQYADDEYETRIVSDSDGTTKAGDQ